MYARKSQDAQKDPVVGGKPISEDLAVVSIFLCAVSPSGNTWTWLQRLIFLTGTQANCFWLVCDPSTRRMASDGFCIPRS